MSKVKNFVMGVKGLHLNAEEIDFIAVNQPLGLILFKRNCSAPEQIKTLTSSFKSLCSGYEPLILLDHEGGRVNRLPTDFFTNPPSTSALVTMSTDSKQTLINVYNNYYGMSQILKPLGFNVNCAPVADLLIKNAHSIIGDRSFGYDPKIVASLCAEACKGLADGGIQSIVKHIPGHGRALFDSHLTLPIVDSPLKLLESTDFQVFKTLSNQKLAMTAHILYSALDTKFCATLSPTVISYIREKIGFNGLIITDDLSMKALNGKFSALAEASLKAGCDILLHCNGEMDEVKEVSASADYISSQAMDKIKKLDYFI